ncbi:MAG: hypothetical protein IT384_20930 [Deltaproteobacteria bacterium]|nr:hypothetical protein [Deltaproteobacteria bacterium]
MRFVFAPFGSTAPSGAAACDGLVPGAELDLSHWRHNKTPAHLKRDTSVEIALAFLEERSAHDLEIATNNHFDADGVLAIWTLLRPELAQQHRSVIVAAAEHGDFDLWPTDERGIWLEIAISSLAKRHGERTAYTEVLRALDALIPNLERHESLWGESYQALVSRTSEIERGRVRIEPIGPIGVVVHESGAPELPGALRARHAPEGIERWLLAFADGAGRYSYRYELPGWSWADTVTRPRLTMPRRGPIRRALGGEWVIKGRLGMTGIAYTDRAIATEPGTVARLLTELEARAALTT